MVRWINQQNWRYEKQHLQSYLMQEKELEELEKFVKENGFHSKTKKNYIFTWGNRWKRIRHNKRKIHRKVASISAIPLLITIISGTIYSFLQPLGIDAFWLIKWHTGNFGIINLQPFYSIFLGITSIVSVISGVRLLQKNP